MCVSPCVSAARESVCVCACAFLFFVFVCLLLLVSKINVFKLPPLYETCHLFLPFLLVWNFIRTII